MWWVFLIGLMIILLVISLLFLRVHTTFYYTFRDGSDYLKLEIKTLGVNILTKEIEVLSAGDSHSPFKQKNPVSINIQYLKSKWEKFRETRRTITSILPHLIEFLSKITIKKLTWTSKLGLDDATLTGVAAGAGWSIKAIILSWINEHVYKLAACDVDVQPLFQQDRIHTELECIFSIRLGQAIRIFRHIAKYLPKQNTQATKEPIKT
ncbi:DUF2953 domain-containing protein [Sediminibacillus albus]|uniref:DUF2953 domain-containing protein n=1 Tax=Sediminibacillus albus TaxID=407036 RepID=A0A1G9BWD2_9BACI|nr:DUF2953 domain-containing protein [Sediminibacillus albus]SDK43484.1 Protein of unknown function [Sediminibacillus albus]